MATGFHVRLCPILDKIQLLYHMQLGEVDIKE